MTWRSHASHFLPPHAAVSKLKAHSSSFFLSTCGLQLVLPFSSACIPWTSMKSLFLLFPSLSLERSYPTTRTPDAEIPVLPLFFFSRDFASRSLDPQLPYAVGDETYKGNPRDRPSRVNYSFPPRLLRRLTCVC